MNILTGDIDFVLDTVIEKVSKENSEQAVYGLIHIFRMCVMGHSLGGSAALGIGRQRDEIKVSWGGESKIIDITEKEL